MAVQIPDVLTIVLMLIVPVIDYLLVTGSAMVWKAWKKDRAPTCLVANPGQVVRAR